MYKTTLTAIFLYLCIINTYALDNQIIIETWYEIEQYSNWEYEEMLNIEFTGPGETKTREMLEEARIILSSMIYGYSFSYIPQDNARGVEDWFVLEPTEEIDWGDPQLEILQCERIENRVFCKILYNLSEYQFARRSSWYSNTIPYTTGQGQDDYFIGQSAKLSSINDAIKEADTIIFATAHKEYRELDINKFLKNVKKDVKILDLWNIYEGKLEDKKYIDYIGLGRGDIR